MTIGDVLLAIITGLAVNECCDVCPWAARKLVRWSAHRRYAPPARAELRAEELAALIDDRPGGLLKLITALSFAATAAVVTRKVSLGVAPPTPLWQPTTPTVPVDYEDSGRTECPGHPNARAMQQACYQLTNEVRNAARQVDVASRSWRRCIKELRRITRDDRWTLVERNVDIFKDINNSRAKATLRSFAGRPYAIYRHLIPADSTIMHYHTAVETARAEIRRLTSDFLLSSAPH